MVPKKRKQSVWSAVAALFLSLLLHAALLLVPLPALKPEPPRHAKPTMVVDLLPQPTTHAPEFSERLPEPKRPEPEETQRPEDPKPSKSAVAAQSLEESTQTEPPIATVPSKATATADRMQAKILSAARTIGQQSEQDGEDDGLQYDTVPALPSRTGWLNQHTGRVDPSVDRWRGNNGSTNARIVTASGQVFCTRRRMPTMEEIFNPSRSSEVTMIRRCGRERPAAPDRSNPWLRAPHGASSSD